MTRYKKKPVVVEAFRVGYDDPPEWFMKHDSVMHYPKEGDEDAVAVIRTLEGVMRASHGDWIIKGVAGELYPCKHAVFMRTYERVS